MSIEIIKENFKVEEIKGNNEVQVLVESEIYLNQDIERFLWVEGKVEVLSTKVIKDKLIVSGLAKFNLVFKAMEEGEINTLESKKDFKEEIDIPGINENMIEKVTTNIEYIEYDLEENKVFLRAVINLFGEVREIRTLEIIKDISGKEDLQILKESINYREIHGRETSYAEIRERIEIEATNPDIEKILKLSVETKELESMVVEDRIIISAEAIVTIVYLGEGRITGITETIPFNHFVEISGAHRELTGEVQLEVVEGLYDVLEDELGDLRIIDLETKIKVIGKAFENKNRELLIDAYSTKSNIILNKEEINLQETYETIYHEDLVSINMDAIDPSEIFEVKGNLNIIDKRYLEEDEILIEGILSLEILYQDRVSEEVHGYKEDYPYKATLAAKDYGIDTIINMESKIDTIDYSINKGDILIENHIVHNIDLSKDKQIFGIKDIEETGELIDKRNKPSIVIYIVQRGDILWDIAKRYNTTANEILSSNGWDQDYELEVGDKIIIEKNVDFIF